METLTHTNNSVTTEEIAEGTATAGITIILGLSALVGLWGVACMTSAFAEYGVIETFTSWFTAVTLR